MFALIAKVAYSNEPVEFELYTDKHTAERYYLKWLEEEGLLIPKLHEVINMKIVECKVALGDFNDDLFDHQPLNSKTIKQVYLSQWLPYVGNVMREGAEKGLIVSNKSAPGWLKKYLVYSQDFVCKVDDWAL